MKHIAKLPKKFSVGSMMLALGLVISGCGTASDATGGTTQDISDFSEMDAVTLKVATLYGPENWNTTPLLDYAEAVTEATEGKVDFEFYYGDSLLPPAEIPGGLNDGVVDLAQVVPTYNAATFPVDDWVSQLGFAPSPSPITGTLQGASATLEWGFETEEYLEDFTNAGLMPLLPRLQSVHTYNLMCLEPNDTLEALDGKRVRVGGEAWAAEAENLGMVPVTMPAAEVYTAFQQGLIECFMGGAEDTAALGLSDHGKNFNAAGLTGWTSNGLFMGQSTWDQLPKIAQDVLWDNLPVYIERFIDNNMEANLDFVSESQTVDFFTPDNAMKEKITSHHNKISQEIVGSAPANIADPEGAVNSYMEMHDKWLEEISSLGYDAEAASWNDYAGSNDDIPDLSNWIQAIQEDILDPNRPE